MNIYSDKVFYLIGGANGSGKTTLARELIGDNPDIHFLNCDDIAREQNVSPLQAGRILIQNMHDIFDAHYSFALETTLAGGFHNKVITRAKNDGYKIMFLYVYLPSVEQNIARVRQRVALGGHDVPEETIRRRYHESLIRVNQACCDADQWEIYNNGGQKYELLAHGLHENAIVVNNNLFSSFVEYRAQLVSKHLLELANRGADKARADALRAGVPLVYHLH